MISVIQAKENIQQNIINFGTEEIPFIESVGRILKENILADRDFPPFNRVAMDGIAINYTHFENGQRSFKIENIQPAGSPKLTMQNTANCIEVMTGAILPNNCDTVIRYEDIIVQNNTATLTVDTLKKYQNVHTKAKDKQQNDVLIHKNTLISPAEIGVIATVGKSTVKVAKQPKVIIIATGDELVDVHENPLEYQIRKSNVYTLVSLLNELHIPSKIVHITDDKTVLKQKISHYLQEYDVVLCSGAVSKGKFDFLPEVLTELGVKKSFHKVTQRPGKPFWFGIAEALSIHQPNTNIKHNKTVVFAFPGNPIATFVNCLVYFYDWYYKSAGINCPKKTAILSENITFKPNLTYFLQVRLTCENGQLIAIPIKGNGSADLASLVNADGFIELPKTENTQFEKGTVFSVISYKK